MVPAERTAASAPRADDESWRGFYFASAALLLLTATIWFVVSRSAAALYAQGYPGDPAAYLQLVSQHQLLAACTWALWIVADFLLIAPTVAMYLLLRREHRTLALLGSALAMFFNVYDICVTELNSLTLVALSQAYAGAGSDAARAALLGAAAYGYHALPIQTVLSFSTGSLGYLLWCIAMPGSIFPRWTAIFGAVVSIMGIAGSASPLIPSSFVLGLFQYLCVPLMALWFVVVGVQLYRHTRRLPMQRRMAAAAP
jgi:hypothetical protein